MNSLGKRIRRRGWQVPIERQAYANRAEEIRDVAADNRIAEMAEHDDAALKQMLGELDAGEMQFAAVSAEEFERLLEDAGVTEGEFPITPRLNESYDYVLIFTTNATEHVFLQNLLGVRVERSYKKTGIGIGRAIPLARAVESLRANRHSLDVQSGDHDHTPAAPKRDRVRSEKPGRRIPARRGK